MSDFDYKILNTLISYGRKKLLTDTDDIALAYIEGEGYVDPKGGITETGYTIAKLLDFNEHVAQA